MEPALLWFLSKRSERMTTRPKRKLIWAVGLLSFAVPIGVLANTAKVESSYCLSIRDQISVSEKTAQASVSKIKAAPSKALWCDYNREYNVLYEKHNGLMRDYARCRHLEEQGMDYNQLIAEYEYNNQRLLTMKGSVAVACSASSD